MKADEYEYPKVLYILLKTPVCAKLNWKTPKWTQKPSCCFFSKSFCEVFWGFFLQEDGRSWILKSVAYFFPFGGFPINLFISIFNIKLGNQYFFKVLYI